MQACQISSDLWRSADRSRRALESMMAAAAINASFTPILFTYDISVFGRRMDYYLSLRGLKYCQCIQPPNMPRPDLEKLGINYRRIPVLAIGRDIYIDTRLIIDKLENLYPENTLGSKNSFDKGLEKVLEEWVIDGGPFWKTSGCIPLSTPVVNDPVWMKDRSDGSGGAFNRDTLKNGRAECLTQLNIFYHMAETMMSDGRKWIFNTQQPTLGDIHGIWSFDWGIFMGLHAEQENPGEEVLNERSFPNVFNWVNRYREAYKEAIERYGKPAVVSSQDAIDRILKAGFTENEGTVNEQDPLRLRKGQRVKISPTDFGFTHADEGELVALSVNEAVIAVNVKKGEGTLRLHYPRINFRITPVESTAANL